MVTAAGTTDQAGATRSRSRWCVVDIVIAAVLAVACGEDPATGTAAGPLTALLQSTATGRETDGS